MAELDLSKCMAVLIQESPEVGQVLSELGIECSDCLASQVDTFPDVARMYNLDLEQILERIRVLQKTPSPATD